MTTTAISISQSPVLNWERYMRNLRSASLDPQGAGEIGTYSGYSQTIRNLGGFWEAKFTMHDELPILADMWVNGWVRHGVISGERGKEVWEGFVGGMELDLTGEVPTLHVTLYGYMRTLAWRVYNQTAVTTDANVSDEVNTIVTAVGQFVASVSRQSNTTQVNRKHDADRWPIDILFAFCDVGDVNNHRFIVGMYGGRNMDYREIAKYEVS